MLDAFILRHVWMHIMQHDPVSCKMDIDISPVRSLQNYHCVILYSGEHLACVRTTYQR